MTRRTPHKPTATTRGYAERQPGDQPVDKSPKDPQPRRRTRKNAVGQGSPVATGSGGKGGTRAVRTARTTERRRSEGNPGGTRGGAPAGGGGE